MPEQKIPEVLAKLISQMRNTGDAPKIDHTAPPANNFVFQVGQGGVLQFVLGTGVIKDTSEDGLTDA